MELTGKIDDQQQFLLDTEEGEFLCILFTSTEDEEAEPEEFDLSGFSEGPVVVLCESFDGDDAWGVTEVLAQDEGDEEDDEEAEDSDETHDDDSAADDADEEELADENA